MVGAAHSPDRSASAFPPGLERLPPALSDAFKQRHLPKLDGLRAIAALLVLYYHFGLPAPAGFGVLVFFVLSGFLITWLLLKEEQRSGTISLRDFYIRRSLRIFPAFYCFWLLLTAYIGLVSKATVPWPQALASLFYVGNYYQGLNGYPISGYSHAWSLGVEEQFYLLWPFAFVMLRGRRRLVAVIVAILVVWIVRVLSELWLHVPEEYIYTAFEMRADHLLLGCLLALLIHGGIGSRFWAFLVARRSHMLVCVALLMGSFFFSNGPHFTRYRDTIGFIVDPVVIALLIPQLMAAGNHVSVRWLDHRVARYLGAISYPIYLYQENAISPTTRLMTAIGAPTILIVLVTTVLVIAAGSLSYHVVEKPFLKLKQRFSHVPTS